MYGCTVTTTTRPYQTLSPQGRRTCTRRGRGSRAKAWRASSASAWGCARPPVSGQARARVTAPSTSAAFSCSCVGGSVLVSLRAHVAACRCTRPSTPHNPNTLPYPKP